MQSKEIRQRFLKFFEKRGHAIIPSAPLVPENDPSTLFTTAGMQPLVPYLLGEKHPKGNRVVNVQKCVRTGDIDEVGDATHLTFFEMMGNWSFGDYFKEDAIKWSYEFLTSEEEGLGLDKERLYVTVFEGNEDAPKDTESVEIWKSLGIPEHRIYFKGAESNWWSPGDNGPCGPDSEMFYDITEEGLGDLSPEEFEKSDKDQKIVEIWNDVFMEYQKKDGKVIGKLNQQNVDTGAGLERMTAVIQKKSNVFETDLFIPILQKINELSSKERLREERIISEHLRSSVFMISDGVFPANTDQGYVLRRLLRRAIRFADLLSIPENKLQEIAEVIINHYKDAYPALEEKKDLIKEEINKEENKFRETLKKGLREFEKITKDKNSVSVDEAFVLFSTYGFPLEMTRELANERGVLLEEADFKKKMEEHREASKSGSEQKFKGGLADNDPKTVMLHTSTHLMLAGLRKYLGEDVHQAGSNITTERTRFDFNYPEKVPAEILKQVEDYVNEAIYKKCDVVIEQMPKEEAQASGVEGSFWEKYPDIVNVYMVKCDDGAVYSKELCGGPHVKNTGDIEGKFKIKKEESSSAGIRRIKAVLE